MTRWASKTTWLRPKDAKTAQKGAKERATSYWECAMSRWASNTTWLHPKGAKTPKKGAKERATSHWVHAMSRWASNATWLPHARLHHTETGTDKRWRNHFGSRRGGLYGVGGSVELVGVVGCGPIAWSPHSWKLPSGSAVGHDLTKPTHRRFANRRLPCLPQTRNVGRKPYNDCRSCPAANNGAANTA